MQIDVPTCLILIAGDVSVSLSCFGTAVFPKSQMCKLQSFATFSCSIGGTSKTRASNLYSDQSLKLHTIATHDFRLPRAFTIM